MTLLEIINQLNSIAISQPAINEYIKDGNIYSLNEKRNAHYAVFCCVQGTHSYNVADNLMTYQFILYYVDRLASDKNNKLQVQSTAVQALTNIIKTISEMNDEVEVGSVDFTPFTDSFDGMCCGQYATISISVPADGCIEIF